VSSDLLEADNSEMQEQGKEGHHVLNIFTSPSWPLLRDPSSPISLLALLSIRFLSMHTAGRLLRGFLSPPTLLLLTAVSLAPYLVRHDGVKRRRITIPSGFPKPRRTTPMHLRLLLLLLCAICLGFSLAPRASQPSFLPSNLTLLHFSTPEKAILLIPFGIEAIFLLCRCLSDTLHQRIIQSPMLGSGSRRAVCE
jgi:hypothetical protein